MPTPTPAIPVFSNGTIYGASSLNALGSNLTNLYNYTMSGFRTYKPITVVRIAGAVSTNSGAYTTLQFDTIDTQTDGMYDSFLTNQGLLYLSVRTAGLYRLYLQFTMTVGVIDTGLTEAHICINGTSVSANSVSGTLVGCRATNTHATFGLSVGDRIYGIVWQGTGAQQNASIDYGRCYLVAEWISP